MAAGSGRPALPRTGVKTPERPRIVVFGSGSIGCFVGGAWQAAGLPVSFIGRQRIASEIHAHGLTLTDWSGLRIELPASDIDYRCSADVLGAADVILVCVKSGATAEAAREIARHAPPGATVLSLQNGVSNMEVLEEELGGGLEVVRGIVPFNVAYLGGGHFHKGVAGEIWADRGPATQAIAAAVADGPAAVRLSDHMLELAWGKLLINLNNAVNALSGRTLIEELRQRDYRRVFAASMREGLGFLKRAGIAPAKVGPIAPGLLPLLINSPDWLFNRLFLGRWKIDAKARSSMADDLDRGRPTEIDFLNGELVRLAASLGLDAPVNRVIVDLVRKAENGAKPMGPEALRREVLGA